MLTASTVDERWDACGPETRAALDRTILLEVVDCAVDSGSYVMKVKSAIID